VSRVSQPSLKPCPFCGNGAAPEAMDEVDIAGEPEAEESRGKWFLVVCNFRKYGCGASGALNPSPFEAIAAWNRRALPPESSAPDRSEGTHTE
jgi:hypothetical protein